LSKQSKTSRQSKSIATQTKRGDMKSIFAGTQRRTRQSVETRQKILGATEKWLITNGYHTFSMGNIANECNISPGNLTYHFPSKELLFTAVVDRITSFYLEAFSRFLSSKQVQTESEVECLIKWLMKDAASGRIARLNRELWMLSSHYPQIRKKISYLVSLHSYTGRIDGG